MTRVEFITKEDFDAFTKEVVEAIEALQISVPQAAEFKLMRSRDVTKELGVGSTTQQKWRVRGILPYSKIGDTIYYKRQDIQKVLDENYTNNFISNPYNHVF